MTLTVRLDAELEERFTAAVRRQHRSKSEVVTELLTRYVEAREPRRVQLALTRFSTFYATDQGLTFAGMAIAIVPPLVVFVVLQRSFVQGLTAGVVRR